MEENFEMYFMIMLLLKPAYLHVCDFSKIVILMYVIKWWGWKWRFATYTSESQTRIVPLQSIAYAKMTTERKNPIALIRVQTISLATG